jgi:hypothetical protein
MKLVSNWRAAGRWMSMRLMALAAAAQVAWETLPAEALAIIPVDWRGYITLALVIAAMIGRLIDQGTATPPADASEVSGDNDGRYLAGGGVHVVPTPTKPDRKR